MEKKYPKTAVQKVFDEAILGFGGDWGGNHVWYDTKIDKETGKKMYRFQVAVRLIHIIPLKSGITANTPDQLAWYMHRSKSWKKPDYKYLMSQKLSNNDIRWFGESLDLGNQWGCKWSEHNPYEDCKFIKDIPKDQLHCQKTCWHC